MSARFTINPALFSYIPPLASTGFRLWDPPLLLSQILLLQTYHYLLLSIILPPLLSTFASPSPLLYEGGACNVAMLLDWREMAGRDTVRAERGYYTSLPQALGRKTAVWGDIAGVGAIGGVEESGRDQRKAVIIGLVWAFVSLLDIIPLIHLVRRPTHILDHCLTLLFIHLLITTYYTSHFPSSFYFWIIILTSTILQIVWAEKLCVEREMREGFREGGMVRDWWTRTGGSGSGEVDERVEMRNVHRERDRGGSGGGGGKVRIADVDADEREMERLIREESER